MTAKKNKDRYLFVSCQGIGNQIEEWPIIWWLLERKIPFDIYYYFWPGEKQNEERFTFIKEVAAHYKCGLTFGDDLTVKNPKKYTGQLVSVWAQPVKGIPVTATADRPYVNEVTRNTSMVWDMGEADAKTEDIESRCVPIDWQAIGGENTLKPYDVIICNGGLPTAHFLRKRYRRYPEVVDALKDAWGDDLTIASVGTPDNYVDGTEDLTGLSLSDTFKAICKARVFLGNDSGLYHFAAAAGIPTVVVFTASNVKKGHNPNFHRSAVVIADDLRCRPCMTDSWEYGVRWVRCQQWRCAEFRPQRIVQAVLARL